MPGFSFLPAVSSCIIVKIPDVKGAFLKKPTVAMDLAPSWRLPSVSIAEWNQSLCRAVGEQLTRS